MPRTSMVVGVFFRAATLTMTSAPTLPRGDVDRVVEAVEPGGRLAVRDDLEEAGQLEIAPNDAAHHHVFHVCGEGRQDRELHYVLGAAAAHRNFAQGRLVRGRRGSRGSRRL